MERKFSVTKRFIGFHFIRDPGKFKKYEQRLNSVAEDLEVRVSITSTNVVESSHVQLTTDNQKRPSNIKINELLQEVLDSRAQHRGDDKTLENPITRCDSPDREDTQDEEDTRDKEDTQKRALFQELLAEGSTSNSQRKGKAVDKPTNRKTKSEEVNQTRPKSFLALEEKKVHPSSKSNFVRSLKKKNGTE